MDKELYMRNLDKELYILQALDDMALCINVATRYLHEHKNQQLEDGKETSLVNKYEIYRRMETCASMLINFKSGVDECKDQTDVTNNTTENNSETGRTEHTSSGDQEQTTN